MTAGYEGIIRKARFLERTLSGTGTVGGTNCPCPFLLCWSGKSRFWFCKTGTVQKNYHCFSSICCTKHYHRAGGINSIGCTEQKNFTGTVGTVLEKSFFVKLSLLSLLKICAWYKYLQNNVCDAQKYCIHNERNGRDSFHKLSLCQNPLFLVIPSIEKVLGRDNSMVYIMEEKQGQFFKLSLSYPTFGGDRRLVK